MDILVFLTYDNILYLVAPLYNRHPSLLGILNLRECQLYVKTISLDHRITFGKGKVPKTEWLASLQKSGYQFLLALLAPKLILLFHKMDLPINIDPDLPTGAMRLPHEFLNHLLEDGYQFDQGVLCLKITSGFGCCYCGMTEFKAAEDGAAVGTIDVGHEINQHLNLVTGEYVHVERIHSQAPALIKIQGHRESFGKVFDLKEQLEKLLVQIKVLNTKTELTVNGPDGPESFTVVGMEDGDGREMDWGLTVETDVKVDFLKTREAEEDERKQREALEALERRVGGGQGHRLGGRSIDRQAWLDRFQSKMREGTDEPHGSSPTKD
jgi:hypothetical protein